MGISFSIAYIGWGLLLSLQPPFYPLEAEKKGATLSQYGFVFGIANLAAFIFAPIFGKFGAQIGPKLLLNLGAFTQGCVGVSFGFLKYVQNTGTFLGLSYFLRFLDGMADAMSVAAGVSILMKLFPNKVSQVVAWTEMLFGLGYMLGPAVGSVLYQWGGFLLPFLCVGIWCFIGAFGVFFTIPKLDMIVYADGPVGKKLNIVDLAKHPAIFLPILDNLICFFSEGMIDVLEPHLRNAGATQSQVGLTFLILGGVYMVTTPIAGYVYDKVKYPTLVSILGNTCMAVAFLLIGPVPFIDLEPTVPLIQGSIGIAGFGYALVMVSTFGRTQAAALEKGFKDDIETYILISGIWSTSFYLGKFLGPTLAGISVDKYGFRTTTIWFFALLCGILVVDFFELIFSVRKTRSKIKKEEYEELIGLNQLHQYG